MTEEDETIDETIEEGNQYEIQETVYQGAEAKVIKCLWLGKLCIIKERLSKGYRHPTLDSRLNKARTKQEIRGMYKARELGIETPAIYFIDSEKNLLVMECINGPTAKHWISQQSEKLSSDEYDNVLEQFGFVLGLSLGKLHHGGLIHGDLTTSNIILKQGDPSRPALIDFGLSSQGKVTAEEKGVDLYVFEKAVVSTHEKSSALLTGLMEEQPREMLSVKRSSGQNAEVVVPSKKAGQMVAPTPPTLVNGKLYFTPIGGITVPRQESEGAISLGELLAIIKPVASLHLTFLLEWSFVYSSYPDSCKNNPMTIVVGEKDAAEDGRVHVIVSTANLQSEDWEFKTQQLYYAFGYKRASEEETKRSPFQSDLIEYFGQYRFLLEEWRNLVRQTDFTAVEDRLIFSTPGVHKGVAAQRLGHPRLRIILSEMIPHAPTPPTESRERCSYISQCSSIGSLGPSPNSWFRGEFLESLEGANPSPKQAPAKMYLIFPAADDVRRSCQGYLSGCSLSYRSRLHRAQGWLQSSMCKWRSHAKRRTLAVPHCKTYAKYEKTIPKWQMVTSANLSKAAWGELKNNGDSLFIRSYEMGVLITDPSRFNFAFDYPLVPYSAQDEPFTTDKHHTIRDIFGNQWQPQNRNEF
ncbi:unnamed protein product [Caenorhabditis sp. 36 PRJEB53466]|nr:unnamed protein product [Caenorhabditis sp. 36 PRJEB53466]